MTTKEFADFNVCVPCNDIREFYADDTHQLHCMTCDWALNELEAARAARKSERAERLPIVEGSKFKARNGEIWTVTEMGRFGRPHWVVSADRCRQTIYHRKELETMQRVS